MLTEKSLANIQHLLNVIAICLLPASLEADPLDESEMSKIMLSCDMIQLLALDGYLTESLVQSLLTCLIRLTEICLKQQKSPLELNHLLGNAQCLAERAGLSEEQSHLYSLRGEVALQNIEVMKDSLCLPKKYRELHEWARVDSGFKDFHCAYRLSSSAEKKSKAKKLHQLEQEYIHYAREALQYPPLFQSLLHNCNNARKLSLTDFQEVFNTIKDRINRLLLQGQSLMALQLLYTVHKDYLTQSARFCTGIAEDMRLFDLNQLIVCLEEIDTQWHTPYQGDWEIYCAELSTLRERISQDFEDTSMPIATLQKKITNGFHSLLDYMLTECQDLLGEPPCAFALAASGSFGRQEMMLNSDLEYMVLVADSALKDSKYFTVFLNLFRFKVASLGEITAKAVGFHLDEGVPLLDSPLRNTPSNVAKAMFDERFYPVEDTGGQTIAFSMLRPRLLYGDPSLLINYEEEINGHCAESRTKAISFLKGKVTEFESRKLSDTWHLKYGYGNYLIHPLLILGIYYDIKEADTFSILRQLSERNIFDKAFIRFYEESLEALFKLRLNSQLYYLKQGKFEEQVVSSSQPREGYYCLTKAEEVSLQSIDRILLPMLYRVLTYFIDQTALSTQLDPGYEYLQKTVGDYQKDQDKVKVQQGLSVVVDYMMMIDADESRHKKYYRAVSSDNRKLYLKLFENPISLKPRIEKRILDAIFSNLQLIPDTTGYRESIGFAYNRLDKAMREITQQSSPPAEEGVVEITWIDEKNQACTRYLTSEYTSRLIASSGKLVNTYSSRHSVVDLAVSGVGLHFKEMPDQPTIEYAIYTLHARLVGQGVPANTLAKFTVKNAAGEILATYPVLISETIGSMNLREKLEASPEFIDALDSYQYTQMILLAALTNPGDGASRQYIISGFQSKPCIYSVDNESVFVEPLVLRSKSNVDIQFRSILFCLNQASQALDRQALQDFYDQNTNVFNVLSAWVKSVECREQACFDLFTEEERKCLYKPAEEICFISRLLLRPGVLGGLLIDIEFLKTLIYRELQQEKISLSAIAMLKALNPRLGFAYEQAYKEGSNPERRYNVITKTKTVALSSRLSLEFSFGTIPSFEDIERGAYTLQDAKKELTDIRPNFSKLVLCSGEPDKLRQEVILKMLVKLAHIQLDLSHCKVLSDELLKNVLENTVELQSLNLRNCSGLTDKAILYLEEKYGATLEELYLSDNVWLRKIQKTWFGIKIPLNFPKLKVFHVSRCVNLETLSLKAPYAKLKTEGCLKLVNQEFGSSAVKLNDVELTDCILDRHEPIKTLVLGDALVGKACIIDCVLGGPFRSFPRYHLGVDFSLKEISHSKLGLVRQQFWHIPYQERFSSMLRVYYKQTRIVIITYDCTRSKTFDAVRLWDEGVSRMIYSPIKILVANKIDLIAERQVSQDVGFALAQELGFHAYCECSAKTGQGVEELVQESLNLFYKQWEIGILETLSVLPVSSEFKNDVYTTQSIKEGVMDIRPNFDKLVLENGEPDLGRQTVILEALAKLSHERLNLSHCAVLDENLLNAPIKTVLLGEPGVGVTCVIVRSLTGKFRNLYMATIGCDYHLKIVNNPKLGVSTTLQIWEIEGQGRFGNHMRIYLKGAGIIMFFYECTRSQTFNAIKEWNSCVDENTSLDVIKVLVANKIDLIVERQVSRDAGITLAKELGFHAYCECSAKTGQGIEELFQTAMDLFYCKLTRPDREPESITSLVDQESLAVPVSETVESSSAAASSAALASSGFFALTHSSSEASVQSESVPVEDSVVTSAKEEAGSKVESAFRS